MSGAEDLPPKATMERLRLDPEALIGSGGQSWVFALDASRIVRVLKRQPEPGALRTLQRFLAGIEGRLPFPTSVIIEIAENESYTIERRLPGMSMLALLPKLSGDERRLALTNFTVAAEAVGSVMLDDRPYGQILGNAPLVADRWTTYLGKSLDRFIAANGRVIVERIGPVGLLREKALALLAEVGEPGKSLVHGDFFPGNVLLDERLGVSGLVDFSGFTVVGDPALDIAGAAIFLEMIEEATPDDVAFVRRIVLDRHGPGIIPVARFHRAYCAFSLADPANGAPPYPKLFPWSMTTLAALRDGPFDF